MTLWVGGDGLSTCVWNCLQLGMHPDQQEARGVPGEGPELPSPRLWRSLARPLRSVSHSPHTDQTTGPGNGSAPAQQAPGRGLSPPPPAQGHPHTQASQQVTHWGPHYWGTGLEALVPALFPWCNILRTVPWKNKEEGVGAPAMSLHHSSYHPQPNTAAAPLVTPSPALPPSEQPLVYQFLEQAFPDPEQSLHPIQSCPAPVPPMSPRAQPQPHPTSLILPQSPRPHPTGGVRAITSGPHEAQLWALKGS